MTIQIAPAEYNQQEMNQILGDIEEKLDALAQALEVGYAVTNGTTTRTLDVTGAVVLDVAKVLGTLIQDMKNRGMLG